MLTQTRVGWPHYLGMVPEVIQWYNLPPQDASAHTSVIGERNVSFVLAGHPVLLPRSCYAVALPRILKRVICSSFQIT